MLYIEVNDTINKIISLYHILWIWENEEKTIHLQWGRKLFHLIMSISFVVALLSGALQCESWDESIFLAASAVSIGVMTVKLIYILWKKDEILSFLPITAVHCFPDECEEFKEVSKKLKIFMNFISFFCLVLLLDVIACAIMGLPIFSNDKRLPLNIGFPLDYKNNEIGFWMAYGYSTTTITFHCAYILITVIIWYIMFNCSIKLQVLEMQFKNLGTTRPGITTGTATVRTRKTSEEEKQNLYLQDLIELIKTHQNIQDIIDRFKTFFDRLFFAQISTSGIIICGCIYVLAFGSYQNLYQVAIYLILSIYNFFDIFIVMYFGNEIKLFSGRLSYGLFQSDWISQSKSCKNCILILMEVFKQPQELVIGVLYPLDLETFTSVSILKLNKGPSTYYVNKEWAQITSSHPLINNRQHFTDPTFYKMKIMVFPFPMFLNLQQKVEKFVDQGFCFIQNTNLNQLTTGIADPYKATTTDFIRNLPMLPSIFSEFVVT